MQHLWIEINTQLIHICILVLIAIVSLSEGDNTTDV